MQRYRLHHLLSGKLEAATYADDVEDEEGDVVYEVEDSSADEVENEVEEEEREGDVRIIRIVLKTDSG